VDENHAIVVPSKNSQLKLCWSSFQWTSYSWISASKTLL